MAEGLVAEFVARVEPLAEQRDALLVHLAVVLVEPPLVDEADRADAVPLEQAHQLARLVRQAHVAVDVIAGEADEREGHLALRGGGDGRVGRGGVRRRRQAVFGGDGGRASW